jgi:hypothetical protein
MAQITKKTTTRSIFCVTPPMCDLLSGPGRSQAQVRTRPELADSIGRRRSRYPITRRFNPDHRLAGFAGGLG